MSAPFRLHSGGLIDRSRTVSFTFDGRAFEGRPGDTLASALLAHGVRLMGRSFKYHRPRGVLGAGVEEPNALVEVGLCGRMEPNTRATDLFLYDGAVAVSQNRWPSLGRDLGAVNQWLAPFIPAGFYYKTFFGGPKLWRLYEHFIRRAAGLGRPPTAPDEDMFDHRAAFCDLLVVGAGPAGLAAALAGARAGARVMLVEQDPRLGGALMRDPAQINDRDGLAWAASVADEVRAAGGRVLTRATATGFHDHGLAHVVQRRVEPGQAPEPDLPAQRIWHVRARRVVLAQGAIERPLPFAGNDRPGVMLASATRSYVARFGVRPGTRAVVAGGDDHIYLTALALAGAGIEVAAVVDRRNSARGPLADAVGQRFEVYRDAAVIEALGGQAVTGARIGVKAAVVDIQADLIAVSGGHTPVVHLHMQAGGDLAWDAVAGAFTPAEARQGQISAGACAGNHGLDAALTGGWSAGVRAAQDCGFAPPPPAELRSASDLPTPTFALASDHAPAASNPKLTFIDFQNDVTAGDVDLAWREGYRSVEHLKRYTTLGMASDQGKTSNLTGLARMAAALNKTSPEVGLTTFRPPYTPVTLGALAGESVGAHLAPNRALALAAAHEAAGVVWQPSGYWRRPRAYPRPGEALAAAALREARGVREGVGMVDVSTLAKFEVAGPDAAAFLELICATSVGRLEIGRGRYTIMLREDGIVSDDGTVWRVGENRFLLTSSTGGADRMAHHLSYVRRVLKPAMRVMATAVQERWASLAVAGPRAASLIGEAAEATPPRHMSIQAARIAGVSVWILGASYSGERAFEVYAPTHEARAVWDELVARLAAAGGALYGLDAMDLLRIEKGHIVTGAEIDGRTSPCDLGLGRMMRKGGFIGWAALQRPDFKRADRLRLIGLEAQEGVLPEGAMLLSHRGGTVEGHVTSAGRRIEAGGAIGLGLLAGGPDRLGETVIACSPTRGLEGVVRIVKPVFYDEEGARYADP